MIIILCNILCYNIAQYNIVWQMHLNLANALVDRCKRTVRHSLGM